MEPRMKHWIVVLVLAALAIGFLWQCSVSARQADEIERAHNEIVDLRRTQVEQKWFLQTLLRMEFRHFEDHMKEWFDGREDER